MKNLLILKFLVLILVISSCKKTTVSIPDEPLFFCKITESETIYYDDNEENLLLSSFTYNASNQVTLWQFNEDFSIKYEYLNNIIKSTISSVDTPDDIVEYGLNNEHKIISENNENGLFNYSYNSDGYLVKIEHEDENNFLGFSMSFQNGNLIKAIGFDESGEEDFEIIFTYSNEPNQNHLNYSELSIAYPFLFNHPQNKYYGKRSKNLLTSVSFGETSYDFEYVKDNKGRITNIIMKEGELVEMRASLMFNCD